jgi:hypothetical protein
MSMMMAYVGSALSHIHESIRLDALKFSNVFLEIYPSVMQLYAGQLLPSCIALLDSKTSHGVFLLRERSVDLPLTPAPTTGKTTIVNPKSQVGSTKSRLEVLETIYKLFQVSKLLSTEKFWYLKGVVPTEVNAKPRSLHCSPQWLPLNQDSLSFNPFTSLGATVRRNLGSAEFYSMSKVEKTTPMGTKSNAYGLDLTVGTFLEV